MTLLRWIAFPLALGLLAACGSMNVISDGADSRLMLKGHDPVAYFTDGRAVPGRPEIRATHDGVTYRFASEEHRKRFAAQPATYAPQFGGYCANGMVYAIPRGGEPENFKIIGGKLYLFDSARSRLYFEMDQERNLKLAEHYWDREVRDSNWHVQSLWRNWLNRVPHYRTDRELADEYERRTGGKSG